MHIRKLIFTGAAALTAAFFLAGTALAFWNVTGEALNLLTVSSYRTELQEQYEVPKAVYPGTSVDKTVHVKNTGTVDTIVRVRFTKAFGTRGTDGKLTPDPSLDPEMIQVACNTSHWRFLDGYWYYRRVLKAGTSTARPLFEKFRISEEAGNEYRGKDAEIVVTMESIQAEGDALSVWGLTEKELGIHYESSEKSKETAVFFAGKEKGFLFDAVQTDLFAGFKNLLPGCARTQAIRLVNQTQEPVSLYLYAEPTQQDRMSRRQLALVEKMLSEYAKIRILNGDTLLYEGPVNGSPKLPDGMGEEHRISLGRFDAQEEKLLTVTLEMDPALDNEFQKLSGKVRWMFCAEGEEPETAVTASVPQTGDQTDALRFVWLLAASGLLFLLLWQTKIRRRRADG